MAKILIDNYTFNKATKQITFTDYSGPGIRLDKILLITDVTNNTIIYQFNSSSLGGTVSSNVLTLTYNTNTGSFNNTDKLQIFYDDNAITTDYATQTTLALIKAKTDNLDVALSTRTKPADTQTVSGSVSVSGTSAVNLSQVAGSAIAQGHGTAASAIRVELPTDGTGVVTANVGTTNGLALDATLTGGTQKAIVRGGAKGATSAADVTSTASGADHQILDVAIYDASGNQVTAFGGSGGTASNFGSAFPSIGTATGYSDGTNMQGARVFDADSGGGTQYVLGVSLRKVASGGSVEAGTSSDPLRVDPTGTTTQPVSGTVTANIGTTNGLALDATLTGGTQKSIVRGGAKGSTTAADVTSTASGSNHQILDVAIYDGSGNQITSFGGGTQYAEDAASAGGESMTLAGAIRQDTIASTTSADGDYANLKVNSVGRLYASATVDAALPAGSNVIGHVIIDSGSTTVVTGTVTVAGASTPSDTYTIPTNAVNAVSVGMLYNTSTLDFVRSIANGNNTTGKGITAVGLLAQFDDVSPTAISENSFGNVRMSSNRNLYGTIRDAAGNERGANVDANNNLGVVLAAETTKVLGVTRTADGAGNLLTSNSTTYSSKFALDGNLLGTLGTAFSTAGKVDVKGADGDVFVRQATAANLNAQVVGAAASGAAKAGNPVQVGGVFNTTQPTVTNGQAVEAQATNRGALIVATGVDTFTVTANAGTNLNTSALALESGGNLASIKTDVDNLNLAQASTTSGQKGNLVMGAVTTAAPSYTTAQTDPLSLTTGGALRGDITTIAGTAPTTAGKLDVKGADGDVFVRQATGTNLHTVTDSGSVTAATLSAETTKVIGTVRVLGNGGATVDSTVAAGTAPTNQVVTGAVYNTTAPAPTNGQAMALQADQAGNLRMFNGIALTTLSGWTSGTSVNATQNIFTNSGVESVLVHLVQGSTISGGAITFEISYDNTNWVTIPAAMVLDPSTAQFSQISLPYTLVQSTNKPFLIDLNGAQALRIKLSTAITGSATVTPNYALLNYNPLDNVFAFIKDAAGNNRGANVTSGNALQVDITTISGTAPTTVGKLDVKGADGDVFVRQTTAANLLATVNNRDGAGNALTSNSTTYSSKFALDVNVLGTLGTAFSTAGKVDVKGADGDVFVRQSTASNLKAQVVSGDATGAAVPANAYYQAGIAKTALPTAGSDGNLTGAMVDKFGRQVVVTGTIRDLIGTQRTTITASTSETTIGTAVASTFLDLVSVVVDNTSGTGLRIDFRDTTAGTIIFDMWVPANDTRGISFSRPVPQTTVNTNWTAQCSASVTDVRIFIQFEKNK